MDLKTIKEYLTFPKKAAEYRVGVDGYPAIIERIMALRKNKRLRLATNKAQDCFPANESTREKRSEKDRSPANEKEQREQRDQLPSNEIQQKSGRDQIPSNENRRRIGRDQIPSNESLNYPQQEAASGSNGRVDGQVYEYTVEDKNGNRRRGKTVLADVWNLPKGHRIVVEVNKENQPIGDEGGVLGYFCGTIARNGSLCSLTYTRWDLVKKGKNKSNEKLILQEVESRFLYPKSLEIWILKSIGHKWRDYKSYLKGKGYDEDTNIEAIYDNCPEETVDHDQWVSLVNFWRSPEGQKRSKRSRESLAKAKVKPIHTSGTKSHARVREEMKEKMNKSPTRTQVYLQCHQHESEADITNQIKNLVSEQGDKGVDLDADPVSKVLGKDQYGRVRGLGLGVKPSDVGDPSYPPFCNGLNMSSDGEAAIMHYFRRLKGQVQRLKNRVKKQGNTITKIKRKLSDYDMSVLDDLESNSDFSDESSSEEEYDNAGTDKDDEDTRKNTNPEN